MTRRHQQVLVADDDEAVRLAIAEVLREDGFEVSVARDGEEALTTLRCGARPGLVVLDLMMPRVTGWQVLDVMERTPDLADIPVIVVTAFDARPGLPPGCRVLHKPFEREVLLAEARDLTGGLRPPTPKADRKALSPVASRVAGRSPVSR
jgi:CheY-like chemotaxis protein